MKIITINIKLRFKDHHKTFQGTIIFATGLSAACEVCFTVQSNAVNSGSKGTIEGVCINGMSVLSGLTLEKM